MKFVLLTQYYPPEVGGAQVFLGSLARELVRQGHDVRVVTALPNYPSGRIFPGYRGRLFMRQMLDSVPTFRTWIFAAQSANMLPRLTSYLSFCVTSWLSLFWIGNPDIVFIDSPPLFLTVTALLMARLKGARLLMNVSDLWPDAVADSGMVHSSFLLSLAARLERFLYRSADLVCTVTEGIHSILRENKHVAPSKLLFLPIGVDTHLFRPLPPDQALLSRHHLGGKKVFLYAGTIGHAQGLSLLLDAADALRDRPDIALVLLGDGPVKADLIAETQRRQLPNIQFANPVPLSEMPAWWSISTAALVTLKDQAIHQSARPSKAFPALASAVPVLFSGAGEMARIISAAQCGIVVPPEQPSPLVEHIRRFADDPSLGRRLGQNGRQLCEAEFSWQYLVGRWLAAISERLPASAPRPSRRVVTLS